MNGESCNCEVECVCIDDCDCGEECACAFCNIIEEDMCDCGMHNYKIVVEIDGNKFSFQSSDRQTLEEVGLKLLPSAFGRFEKAVEEILE